jgi:hypothetical protein
MIGCWGRSCHQNVQAKEFQSWNSKNTFVQLDARPLAANAAQNASKQ